MLTWAVLGLTAARAGELPVQVDREVELVSLVFHLAGTQEYAQAEPAYADAIDSWFGPHRAHPVVQMVAPLRAEHGVGFDAVVSLGVHLDEDLLLQPGSDRLDARWTPDASGAFLKQLRRFARATDWDAFWAAQAPYRAQVEARYVDAGAGRVVAWLDRTFGPVEGAHYALHPGLLAGRHAYGVSARVDGKLVMSPVVGPQPSPGRHLEDLLVHEFGHAYVNPALDAQRAILEEPGRAVHAHVASRMASQAYKTWNTVVNESGVRALTVLYALDTRGEDQARARLDEELGKGFGWVDDVVAWMDAHRHGQALDLQAHVAELAALLAAWAAAPDWPQGFRGPINAALDLLGAGAVLIAPAELAYADAMHARFFAQRGLARVDTRWQPGQATVAEVHYGTPSSSPLLAARLAHYGVALTETGVVIGGESFEAERPRLILARPHPDDADVPVVIYAAWHLEDVNGLNGLRHGATDWLVADGDRVLSQWNYASDSPALRAEPQSD